jgi:hypothetical protein
MLLQKLLESSSLDERKEHFSAEIEKLEKLRNDLLNKQEDRFYSHEQKAMSALHDVLFFYRKVTGYNCGWIAEEVIKHCSNAGRSVKYDTDTRLFNSILIDQLMKRGSSQRQAAILVAKIRNDTSISIESAQKELMDTFREYEKSDIRLNYQEITEIPFFIVEMLKFDLSKEYSSEEKAFSEALSAYQKFWQDIVDLMKEYHPIIAQNDRHYPEIFGCVIEWLNENYENPREYFYKPASHKSIPLAQRRYCLSTYLGAVAFFKDTIGNSAD